MAEQQQVIQQKVCAWVTFLEDAPSREMAMTRVGSIDDLEKDDQFFFDDDGSFHTGPSKRNRKIEFMMYSVNA